MHFWVFVIIATWYRLPTLIYLFSKSHTPVFTTLSLHRIAMVNGFRELNPTGKYLRNVGKLIQQINLIQKRNNSEQHPLLFVSENVKFEADKVNEVSDCYEGLPPFRRCASDFSPCKRDRLYWINVSSSEHSPEEHVHVILFSQ